MRLLTIHAHIAITSFVGSFVLIRYKLLDARVQVPTSPETPVIDKPGMSRFESAPATLKNGSSFSHTRSDTSEVPHTSTSSPFLRATQAELLQIFQNITGTASQFEGRVSIHQVRPFHCFSSRSNGTNVEPPVRLLSNCHTLSVTMSVAGFVLALLGILMFAWTALPVGIGAFASACLGTCLLGIFATLSFS